ncbi:MAG: hypothetical protein FJ098_03125 [Deltaproteobacteria bacterium]|nr:hypothetical protein [Deltaproteobacteria bacterium]
MKADRNETRYYSNSLWYHFEPLEARWFEATVWEYDPVAVALYQQEERRLHRRDVWVSTATMILFLTLVSIGVIACDDAGGIAAPVEPTVILLCHPDGDPCPAGETCRWDWDRRQASCLPGAGLGVACREDGPMVSQIPCLEGICHFVPAMDQDRCVAKDPYTPCTAENAWTCGPTMRCADLYRGGAPIPGQPAICLPRECYSREDCGYPEDPYMHCVEGLCVAITPCKASDPVNRPVG